jgi:hypothetical protein
VFSHWTSAACRWTRRHAYRCRVQLPWGQHRGGSCGSLAVLLGSGGRRSNHTGRAAAADALVSAAAAAAAAQHTCGAHLLPPTCQTTTAGQRCISWRRVGRNRAATAAGSACYIHGIVSHPGAPSCSWLATSCCCWAASQLGLCVIPYSAAAGWCSGRCWSSRV